MRVKRVLRNIFNIIFQYNKKGIRPFAEMYLENFQSKQINGRKLSVLDFSDLGELIESNFNHQILIFKSIQNLLQLVSLILFFSLIKQFCFD